MLRNAEIFEVLIQNPTLAKVTYTTGTLHVYKAKVEVTGENQVTVTPPPAAFPKDEEPIEFSEADLKAILQLMLRESVEFISSTLLDNNGVIQRVFTLKPANKG